MTKCLPDAKRRSEQGGHIEEPSVTTNATVLRAATAPTLPSCPKRWPGGPGSVQHSAVPSNDWTGPPLRAAPNRTRSKTPSYHLCSGSNVPYQKDTSPGNCECDQIWENRLCRCNYGKGLKRKSSRTRGEPKPNDKYLYLRKERERKRERRHRKGGVMTETEVRAAPSLCGAGDRSSLRSSRLTI